VNGILILWCGQGC